MLLEKSRVAHLNCVTHEGKLLVLATDVDGRIWYATRQEGFEPQYLATPADLRTGWEPWRELPLPADPEDPSVLERERARLTRGDDPEAFLLRSCYRTKDSSAVAPVQLVSAGGHLHVFRQSKAGTLYCDRFVHNGANNLLTRKLEVRYKRSRQRYAPSEGIRDTLDFCDLDGDYFYEPTTELCMIEGLRDGWFSVVRVPTAEHDVHRWHVFAYDHGAGQLVLHTLRAADDGLFDPRDAMVYEPLSSADPSLLPRRIPGLIRRTLALGAKVVNGPVAVRYDLQRQVGEGERKRLVKTVSRVMLAVPTDRGTVAVSFAIAGDGTLSQVSRESTSRLLRAKERNVPLPLSALDGLRPLADTTPPPTGVITSVANSTPEMGTEGRVVIQSPEAAVLAPEDRVRICGTSSYDGVYLVRAVTPGSFEIAVEWVDSEVGRWEVEAKGDEGLIFDGMVTAYEKTLEGMLKVTALEHGLEPGDEVELRGTRGHDGTYPVVKLDETQFVIERPWPQGEAINLTALRRKRRGLVLDGVDDYAELPGAVIPEGLALTVSLWAKGGASLPTEAVVLDAVDEDGEAVLRIAIPDAEGSICFEVDGKGEGKDLDRANKAAEPGEYRDQWVHWTFVRDAVAKSTRIYRNGALWHEQPCKEHALRAAARVRLGTSARSEAPSSFYPGEIGDLRIYGRPLSDDDIRRSMYAPLHGVEVGLSAYYRLAALREDNPPNIVDLSAHARDGVVHGGASVGIFSLPRTLADELPATRYLSEARVAVEELGDYIAELEFRVQRDGGVELEALDDFDGQGHPIFALAFRGAADRGGPADIDIPTSREPFEDAGDGFFRARARFIVPAGAAMIRALELDRVVGEFSSLEIRRFRLRKLDDTVTEASYEDAPAFEVIADGHREAFEGLAVLGASERREANLRLEQAKLAGRLDNLARLEETKLRLDALRRALPELREAQRLAVDRYEQLVAHPFSYLCSMHNDDAGGLNVQLVPREQLVLEMEEPADTPAQRWRFRDAGGGTYFIETATTGPGQRLGISASDSALVTMQLSADTPTQRWRLKADGSGGYFIHNLSIGEQDQLQLTRYGQIRRVELKAAGNAPRFRFTVTPTDEQASSAISDAFADMQRLSDELATLEAELTILEAVVTADEPQRVAWRTRLAELGAELDALRDQMDRDNAALLTQLCADTREPLVMPELAKDERGLGTQGAVLEFSQPASRLSALESCEGNVELAYFDRRGRMRRTRYDATADERNAKFEEWLDDGPRACLDLERRGGVVALPSSLALPSETTLEVWTFLPLPARAWNVLISDEDGTVQGVVVRDGRFLGVRAEGMFFAADASLAELPVGWHHIAAVKRGAGADTSVSFHVDGRPFGAPVRPRLTALHLDGINDFVELPPPVVPTGAQISVAFWARADSSRASVILQAVDALGLPVLSVALPGEGGTIEFEAGNDGQRCDRVSELARREDYRERWAHFALTKNADSGSMKIYRNGALWHEQSGLTRLLSQAVSVCVGRACDGSRSFEGRITDLRLWSRELTEFEIGALVGAASPSLEVGLTVRYRFVDGLATDTGPAARHGTLRGDPRPVDVTASLDRIAFVGNGPRSVLADPSVGLARRVTCFNGEDAHIAFPAIDIDPAQGYSIELWARFESFKHEWAALIDLGGEDHGSNRIVINNSSDGGLNVAVLDGAGQHRNTRAPRCIQIGQWMHVALTVDPEGAATLYIDGRVAATASLPNPEVVTRSVCYIGRNSEADLHFDGQIAQVRLWSGARSDLQIQDSMYHRLSGREPGLIGYWPLDDLRVDLDEGKVLDLAGELDGTAVGGLSVIPDETFPVGALEPAVDLDESFGRVAELRVWGAALSAEEVTTNSKITLTGNEPGLVAYYPMAEGRGAELHDRTGHHEPAVVQRRLSAAVLAFDGVNDSVVVPDASTLRLSTYTIEVWVKPLGLQPASWTGLFGKQGRSYALWVMNNGGLHHRFHVGDNTNAGAPNSPAGSIRWHHWNHIALTNDGVTARTYVNGELLAQGPTHGMPVAHSTPLYIGVDYMGNRGFRGRMADMRVWDHARSQAEIQATMRAALSGAEDGLVACWPMNGVQIVDGQRTLLDLTGNHRAQVTATSTVADMNLPIDARARILPDPSQWWGFTGAIGTLDHRVLSFDGDDDFVELGTQDLNLGEGLTLEAWVHYDSFQSGSRIFDLGVDQANDSIIVANHGASRDLVFGVFAGSEATSLQAPSALRSDTWMHVAASVAPDGAAVIYLDGEPLAHGEVAVPASVERPRCYLGRSNVDTDAAFHGRLAEARIWTTVRSPAQIRAAMYERLTGHEPGLAGYWPLASTRPGAVGVLSDDRSRAGQHAELQGVTLVRDDRLPLGADALVAAEHRAADLDPTTGRPYLLMRRARVYPTPEGARLLAGERVEELTVEWIGNAQFEPTLLGYIEGAPPVPSENLTERDDYNGATFVELISSEDVEFRWNRNEEFGAGGSVDLFLGADVEVLVGLGAYTKALDLSIGARGSLNFSKQSMHESNVSSQSSVQMTDRLELRGTAETQAKFPHLGRRFIPKNVGYALLISGLADVYATRLARSGAMIGVQARPVEGVAPEVNTVTFLMNPAYVMQGSLDGMTGSSPTSNRYMRDLPELRDQFGSSYPCSFYRPDEARALEEDIARQDMERELVYEAYQIKPGFEEFADPGAEVNASYSFEREVNSEVEGWPSEMQQTWKDPTVTSPPAHWEDDWVKRWNKEAAKQQREQAEDNKDEQADMIDATKAKIQTLVDKVGQINGTLGLEEWQRKMDDLRTSAGKRNIVNTYVWDADGGLRSESQSFASTVEHTIGGTFSMDGSLGLEASVTVGQFKGELTAMATMNMTQTVSKTESYTKGIELLVDLYEMEGANITDYDDRPLFPGQKVDRYRFKSFYLEGSTKNHKDFFRTVVDPNWLRSNDEEAVVLRQAMAKANKAWRVMHRVTYVERPGNTTREATLPRAPELSAKSRASTRLDNLVTRTRTLESKLNQVLELLQAQANTNEGGQQGGQDK